MPANLIDLPTEEQPLATVVNAHFDRERIRLMPTITMFKVIREYLAGARRFDVVDLNTGMVKAYMLDEDGKMEFQSSDLLKAIDQVVGYMGSYDLSPKVQGDGHSLAALKEAAVGQVVADSVYSEQDVQAISPTFLHLLASLGCCGVTSHIENHPGALGLTADLEVIHPMELIPFPSTDGDLSKQRGLGRESYVPLARLEEKFGKAKIAAKLDQLYGFQVQTGQSPESAVGTQSGNSYWTSEGLVTRPSATGNAALSGENTSFTSYIRVREVWLDGPRGTCSRKITVSGKVVLEDLDFKGVEAYCPIGMARFMENGTFHGAGMYHVLWSVVRQLELMNKTLFNDVIDDDKFGFLLIPQGSVNMNQVIKPTDGGGLKLLPWEYDQFSDVGARPFHVQPKAMSDAPTRAAVYASQYLDKLNPLVDIIREKGRVDSERGLAFLQERVDQAMTSPTRGVIRAFGQMYKAGLARASSLITENPTAIPVTKLTLDLAGAVIDWKRNEVKFPDNPLPSVTRLKCRPKLTGAKSVTQRKMEAMELLTNQLATPLQVKLKAIEEGWDLAMWMDTEIAGHQSGIRNILTLYNDGITPGELEENPNYVRADIQQMLVDSFIGSYKMKVASVDVQNEFIAYREFLIQQNGRTIPAPYSPDDAAVAMGGQIAALQAARPPMQG